MSTQTDIVSVAREQRATHWPPNASCIHTGEGRVRSLIHATAVTAVLILRGVIAFAHDGRGSDSLSISSDAGGRSRTEWGMLQNDTIPSDFPAFQIHVFDNPSPGKIFLCPFLRGTPRYAYLSILDEMITPVFLSRGPESMNDFKLRPDGTKALEIVLSPLFAVYRTFRFSWTTVDVHEPEHLPATATLLPAYPNPFDASTTISFSIPRSTFTTLKIFNGLGQEVRTQHALAF